MLELIFIGTGSAIESLNRFHSSSFIQTTEYNLLIDAGDCVSKALLKQKINYHSIDGIIFTHFHPNHFSGFGGLIIQMEFLQREKPLQPSRLYLTHISDDDGQTIEKIINQTSAFDVPTIEAVDGMKIII